MESINLTEVNLEKEEIEYSNYDQNNKVNEWSLLNNSDDKNKNFIENKTEINQNQVITPINEENMFGIKDEDLDLILHNFSIFISDIDLKTLTKISDVLERFFLAEKKLKNYLKSLNNLKFSQLRLLHMLTHEMLTQKFQEKENIFKNEISKLLDSSYQNLLNSDILKEDFSPYFELITCKYSDNQKFNVSKIKEIFKEIISIKFAVFISFLEINFKSNNIPHFLINFYKKKIKHRIKLICNPLVKEHYHKIIENKLEVNVLKGFFEQYTRNLLNIFDFQILTKKNVEILYEIFIISNIEYLKNDPIAMKTFISNLPKYIKIMRINQLNDNNDVLKISQEFYINKKIDEIYTYFEIPLLQRENMIKSKIENLKNFIGDYNEKYFFVIFCFSLMLNNIIKTDISISGNYKYCDIVLNDKLICNSRERQFLSNILKSLQNYFNSHYDPFTINSYTQSVLITNILKSRSVEMFDHDLILKLEKINIQNIEKSILECDSQNYLDNSNHNDIGNDSLCLNEEFLEEFISLLNKNKTVSIKNEKEKYSLTTYFKSIFDSIYDYTYPDDKVDLTSYYIMPLNQFTLSTNACICISGFGSEDIEQIKAWENMTVDLDKYIDFYFLNWPSESLLSFLKDILFFVGKTALSVITREYISAISNMHSYTRTSNAFLRAKNAAKVCGKLLAHILASRTIFKFQTFNLVGFSLGSHIIKHCLKEMYRLSEINNGNLSCRINSIIQNVVFVAGATSFKNKDKWQTIFQNLVAGRVINCHGNNDNILKFLYRLTTSKIAIGQSSLNLGENLNNYKIQNYDFSDLGIDHHQYRKNLKDILKRIKLS